MRHHTIYRNQPDTRTVQRYRLIQPPGRGWQVLHHDTLLLTPTPRWVNSSGDYATLLDTYDPDNSAPDYPTPEAAVEAHERRCIDLSSIDSRALPAAA